MTENWPLGVPRNFDELERDWGKYIANTVARNNKVGRNFEDLHQFIWEKLLGSNLLEKYVEKLMTTAPEEIGVDAAIEFLGINYPQWRTAMYSFHNQKKGHWMPTPAKGTVHSRKAIFAFTDIMKLSETPKAFTKRAQMKVPSSRHTDANFGGYLRTAIHNHFANFVRYKERREKERPHDQFHQFTNRLQHMADPPPWEEMLVDPRENMVEVGAELSMHLKALAEAVGPHKAEISILMEDGKTLPEAVRHLNISVGEKRALTRALALANVG